MIQNRFTPAIDKRFFLAQITVVKFIKFKNIPNLFSFLARVTSIKFKVIQNTE